MRILVLQEAKVYNLHGLLFTFLGMHFVLSRFSIYIFFTRT